MAANYGKFFLSVLDKWRETDFENSPPEHLVWNAHIIANFLSFQMSLVIVMDCGAGNVPHAFEIILF